MAKIPPIDLSELFGVPAVSYEQLEAELADVEKEREAFIRSADIGVAQYDGAIHLLNKQMSRALAEAAARDEKRKAAEAEEELRQRAEDEAAGVEPGPAMARSVMVPVLVPDEDGVSQALAMVPDEVMAQPVQPLVSRRAERAAKDAKKGNAEDEAELVPMPPEDLERARANIALTRPSGPLPKIREG